MTESSPVPGGAAQVVAVAQQRQPCELCQRPQAQAQRRRREGGEDVQRQLPQAARQLLGSRHAALMHVAQPADEVLAYFTVQTVRCNERPLHTQLQEAVAAV